MMFGIRREWLNQPKRPILSPRFASAGFFYTASLNSGAEISHALQTSATSGTSIVKSRDGYARRIDTVSGTANYMQWASSTLFDPPASGYSVMIYVMRSAGSSANYDRIFGRDVNASTNGEYGFLLTPNADATAPNRIYVSSRAGGASTNIGYVAGNPVIPVDTWWLYVYTHDGTNGRLYANGALVDTVAHTIAPSSSLALRIGDPSGAGNAGAPCDLEYAAVLPFVLSGVEIGKLAQFPNMVYAPFGRRLFAPITSAAPTFNPSWARGATSIVGSGLPGG